MKKGNFVISLDFEIFWGVWDVIRLDDYHDNLLGVRTVIPGLLLLFDKHKINATFATVGLLFFNDKKEMLEGLPERKPAYTNPNISPYTNQIDTVGNDETEDVFHFAPSLIKMIQQSHQEVACHTFSHYYCLESGQTIEDFREDLRAAKRIAEKRGIALKSFVFPRNQYNEDYLKVCKEEGIESFRGNEESWLYKAKEFERETLFRRGARLLDAHMNLSGHHCHEVTYMEETGLYNIPASRFLRPYSKRWSFLEKLRLKRITNSMTYAAKHGLTYHLWWHPHNFGTNIRENLAFLEKVLVHFHKLSDKYGFRSVSMQQLTDLLKHEQE
ncbi:MAG TPA: polysaccharide deacetylase family protein [Ferruginibacter sp.]|nr:polysaccharide deacetylase family protein [Ferruginibacter sp.]